MPDPAPAPAPAPAPTPWYTGKIDAETIGYLQNRALADKSPEEVAIASIKAHREAEKFVGAPANQLLRLPTDPGDAAGWAAVHERLGAPKDKTGYDLANVKFADGTAPDDAFLDFIRTQSAALHLPKDAAPQLAAAFTKFLEGNDAAEAADRTVALQKEKDTLKANWGPNSDANLLVAKAGAAKLGMTAEDVAAFEGVVGFARVMEILRVVGSKTGEDRWVTPPTGSGDSRVMSIDAAKERKASLMVDKDFIARYNKGDTAAQKEMLALNTIIVGDDTEDSRRRS